MAMPRVPGTKADVPTGPTGHLSSSRKPVSTGGRRPGHGSASGLTNTPMKVSIGKGRSLTGRR